MPELRNVDDTPTVAPGGGEQAALAIVNAIGLADLRFALLEGAHLMREKADRDDHDDIAATYLREGADFIDALRAALPALLASQRDGARLGIYVASRARHGAMWRAFRDEGFPITATWIDESGEGETSDWSDLWARCIAEASAASAVILYAPLIDGELKGALVEVGAALAANRPVYFVGDGVARRYSWLAHPNVVECASLNDALLSASRPSSAPAETAL